MERVCPNYEKANIVKLYEEVFLPILGLGGRPLSKEVSRFVEAQRLVVVFLDGLGYNHLLLWSKRIKRLSELLSRGELLRITTTFPSSTATALISATRGLEPIEHGVVGYFCFIKEVGAVCRMLEYSPATSQEWNELEASVPTNSLVGGSTVFEKLRRRGVKTLMACRKWYVGSAFHKLISKGAEPLPFAELADAMVSLAKAISSEEQPLLAALYWEGLDSVGHTYGPSSPEYGAELEAVAWSLRELFANRVSANAREESILVVVSDHGMVDTSPAHKVMLNKITGLMEKLEAPPMGDFRATLLRTKPGQEEAVAKLMSEKLGDRVEAVLAENAVDEGLYGRRKPSPLFLDQLRGVLAVPKDPTVLVYPYTKREADMVCYGHHGGLSPDEIYIPLWIAGLSDL